jgi:hypothetical protein
VWSGDQSVTSYLWSVHPLAADRLAYLALINEGDHEPTHPDRVTVDGVNAPESNYHTSKIYFLLGMVLS